MSNLKYQVKKFAFIGRTLEEYCQMFDLSEKVLSENVFLDCPAGACSFVAEANKRGIQAKASDIEYGIEHSVFSEKCQSEIEAVKNSILEAKPLFDWSYYQTIDGLLEYRKRAAALFLEDYKANKNRYVQAKLPSLPFGDNEFDIILSGHFLFLYADRISFKQHLAIIQELLRVAKKEIRIYPLIGLDGTKYAQLNELTSILNKNANTQVKKTSFSFLKGSNEFLYIKKLPYKEIEK